MISFKSEVASLYAILIFLARCFEFFLASAQSFERKLTELRAKITRWNFFALHLIEREFFSAFRGAKNLSFVLLASPSWRR